MFPAAMDMLELTVTKVSTFTDGFGTASEGAIEGKTEDSTDGSRVEDGFGTASEGAIEGKTEDSADGSRVEDGFDAAPEGAIEGKTEDSADGSRVEDGFDAASEGAIEGKTEDRVDGSKVEGAELANDEGRTAKGNTEGFRFGSTVGDLKGRNVVGGSTDGRIIGGLEHAGVGTSVFIAESNGGCEVGTAIGTGIRLLGDLYGAKLGASGARDVGCRLSKILDDGGSDITGGGLPTAVL
jgi:hypothetical protein